MAELDLYGDLYGDADEAGSPPSLSPHLPQPSVEAPTTDAKPVMPVKAEPGAPQPTTFSIATYEDPAYGHKKNNDHHSSGESHWQVSTARTPMSPSLRSPSSAGPGRSGLWGVKPSDMPDEGKMFVGGLNWETTEDALKHYFSQFGAVVHCTIMRDPTNGRSRGFAFLTFADPSVVNKVMVKEHFLDGKLIDPKRAIPRGSGPIPSALPNSSMGDKRPGHHFGSETAASLSNKLFCRGMPDDTTPQSFRAYWAQFGTQVNIEEAVLMMDRDSNRHRGFGFVNLVTGDDADQLLKCGPFTMDGHPLEVKKKAPSRARYDSRDEMNKMAPAPIERYPQYPTPGHHDHAPYNSNGMTNFFKNPMGGPNWKTWNPAMLQPMAPNRGGYMGGMNNMHDDRGARGMGYDNSAGMAGGYGSGYRSSNPAYAPDWRSAPSGVRGPPAAPAYGAYHHHHVPPASVGPTRNQRPTRNYAPY